MARFFECKVMVRVPDIITSEWSDGGAETFDIARFVNDMGGGPDNRNSESVRLVDYKEIQEKTYLRHRYDTITKEGGV